MIVLRVLAGAGGAAVVGWVLLSAIRTVVLPRGAPVILTQAIFVNLRRLVLPVLSRLETFERRDQLMSMYAPIGLVLLPFVWVTLVVAAATPIYWALGVSSWRVAFYESGSSLTTLGYTAPSNLWTDLAAVIEAVTGLGLVALVISYLPSIYGSFQRRELMVTLLTVRAGSPPGAANWLIRNHRIGSSDRGGEFFRQWEEWFADVEETHTSLPMLAWFRSPHADRSWITGAGAVLDAAALRLAVVEEPWIPEAALCLRAGYLCLRRVGDVFGLAYDDDPAPDDPIVVDRSEFDAVLDRMGDEGVPLKEDREQAWRDFQGWRVNYDRVLVQLANLVVAPVAPWSSDRSLYFRYGTSFSMSGVLRSVREVRRRAGRGHSSE